MTVTSIQVCGNSAPPSYSTTVARYQTIFGDIGAATTEANAQYKVNDTLTAKNLLAQVATNAVTAATTLSTRKNGATGNLTVSITALTTGAFEDTTNSDSLVVGDQFNYTFTLGSANSLGISIISVTFDHNASATVFLGTINDTGSTTLANAVIFWPINGDFGGSPTTEANAQFKTEMSSTLSRLACFVATNSSGGADTVVTRKNTANGNMSLSIGASSTGYFEQSPLSTTDSTVAGDLYNFEFIGGGMSTASTTIAFVAVQEQASNSSNFHTIAGGSVNPASTPSTQYTVQSGDLSAPSTETNAQLKVRGGTFNPVNLFVRVTAAASGGINGTQTRINGTNGNLFVSFGTGTGVFEDTAHVDSYAPGNTVNHVISHTTTAPTPTITYIGIQWVAVSVTAARPRPIKVHVTRPLMSSYRFKSGHVRKFGKTPRVGVTSRRVPASFVKKRGLLTPQTRGGRGKSTLFGRTPRIGVTSRHVPGTQTALHRQRGLPRLKGRVRPYGRTPRVGVTTRPVPPEKLVLKKRGLVAPTTRGGRGHLTQFGRTPRVGVTSRRVPSLTVKHRVTPLPRGRSRALRILRVPPVVTSVAPQERTIRKLRRIQPLPRGKFRPFGRTPRIGVTVRRVPFSQAKKRTTPLPKGRMRKVGWMTRTPPVVITAAPQERTIRKLRRLQPLPKGRARPFGRTPRIGVTTRPVPLSFIKKQRRLPPPPKGRGKKVTKAPATAPAPVGFAARGPIPHKKRQTVW